MTLSAFAEVGKPTESVNATVAAASKELNELRMGTPETTPRNRRGVTLSRAEALRQAHPLSSYVLSVRVSLERASPFPARATYEATVCLTRSAGADARTRSGVPAGAARRYCLGQDAVCPSSCAACSGQ